MPAGDVADTALFIWREMLLFDGAIIALMTTIDMLRLLRVVCEAR